MKFFSKDVFKLEDEELIIDEEVVIKDNQKVLLPNMYPYSEIIKTFVLEEIKIDIEIGKRDLASDELTELIRKIIKLITI